jgi:hypothetical protein
MDAAMVKFVHVGCEPPPFLYQITFPSFQLADKTSVHRSSSNLAANTASGPFAFDVMV